MSILRFFSFLFLLGVIGAIAVAGVVVYGLWHYGRDLPEYAQLAEYEPPVASRAYAGDGRLLAEFARENRLYVPIESIPKRVKDAFLAAEDKYFYDHKGVNFLSIGRAVLQNVQNYLDNRRPVGASTITQQVAKNFLLTNEVSVDRKVREALLAMRIEKALSKDRILELYLNEIFLGHRSYGVAAAALNYFDKTLEELTIEEAAFLAALPKGPSNYDPERHPQRAKERRDWVIGEMAEAGFIGAAEAVAAKAVPLTLRPRRKVETVDADWISEEVRRTLLDRMGEEAVYGGGLMVSSTVDPDLQALGERVLRDGLEAYDRRHGWRGPLAELPLDALASDRAAAAALAELPGSKGLRPGWARAVVTDIDAKGVGIVFADASSGRIPFAAMEWARPWREDQRVGREPRKPSDVLNPGDVVAVSPRRNKEGAPIEGEFALEQVPDVNGALVAMDPHTGRVLAMVGGWDFQSNQYNRATQAKRQPGSAFKPFVYAAALDSGYTPATIIVDGPISLPQGPGLPDWTPTNYSNRYYGPSTMRLGLEKSRNLMTVRMAHDIGMEKIVDYAKRFGVDENMPALLAMSLGSGETTLMDMSAAYAEFVNGGKKITPTLIDRVQDRNGHTVYRHDTRPCDDCEPLDFATAEVPRIPDTREQIIDPHTAYQVVSMLEGVVQRGTGARISAIGKPLAGKTGTTNDSKDAWFMGFSPDLVVGVFVGFDDPKTLGPRETGSSAAVPIFKAFMEEALADDPGTPFRVPPGIRLVRVNAATGEPARYGDTKTILEAFKPGTEPNALDRPRGAAWGSDGFDDGDGIDRAGLSGTSAAPDRREAVTTGTGGLY